MAAIPPNQPSGRALPSPHDTLSTAAEALDLSAPGGVPAQEETEAASASEPVALTAAAPVKAEARAIRTERGAAHEVAKREQRGVQYFSWYADAMDGDKWIPDTYGVNQLSKDADGDLINETADHSNLAWIAGSHRNVASVQVDAILQARAAELAALPEEERRPLAHLIAGMLDKVQRASSRGMASMLDISPFFYNQQPIEGSHRLLFSFRPNGEARFQVLAKELERTGLGGAIASFYNLDEPFHKRFSPRMGPAKKRAAIEAVNDTIHRLVPGSKVSVIYGLKPNEPAAAFPRNFDWVGYDRYPLPSEQEAVDTFKQLLSVYGRKSVKRYRAAQGLAPVRLIAVPDANLNHEYRVPNGDKGDRPETWADIRAHEPIWERIVNHPDLKGRFVAVAAFFLQSMRSPDRGYYWGASKDPQTQALYVNWGRRITDD